MPIDNDIRQELDKFDKIFDISSKDVDLSELLKLKFGDYIDDERNEFYYGPTKLQISKLTEFLNKKEDNVSKFEIVELFLSALGVSLDSLLENVMLKLNKIKEIANNSDFEIISFDENYKEIEIKKEINDWELRIFYNSFNTDIEKDEIYDISKEEGHFKSVSFMIISLNHQSKASGLLNREEINTLVQEHKSLELEIELFGQKRILNYMEMPKRSSNVYKDLLEFFQDDQELKKLNLDEVIKDVNFSISTKKLRLGFKDEEYGYYSYYPYLLINGSNHKIKKNLTKMRDSIVDSGGRYLEVSKRNINKSEWDKQKEEVINGFKALN